MERTYFILGRQPALGIAELESLFGPDGLRVVQPGIVELSQAVDRKVFRRLGGSLKMAKLLTISDTTDWRKVTTALTANVGEHAGYVPEGKLTIGLSVYGLRARPQDINAAALGMKKAIRASDPKRPVRIVPNKSPELNSAQVLHNQLTGERGWELLFIRDGNQTIIAQTTGIQDIEAYAARDQARPMRDTRVGMLPPKLAQIIINLANPEAGETVLDPFCGTGVILQEAQLMGYDVYGTDLETRMIDYSRGNIEWLQQTFRPEGTSWRLEQGDATSTNWTHEFTTVACETYLGRPFSAVPPPQVLQEVMKDVDYIHKKFFLNLARQTKTGFRACIAVPAWRVNGEFKHLPILDRLEEMGYTRVSFVHAGFDELIYHRSDQIVARELIVLQRK